MGGRARLGSGVGLAKGRTVRSLSSSMTRRALCRTVEVLVSVGIDALAGAGVPKSPGDSLAAEFPCGFPCQFPLLLIMLVRLASRRLNTLDAVLSSGS